jgi:hypothetical protein
MSFELGVIQHLPTTVSQKNGDKKRSKPETSKADPKHVWINLPDLGSLATSTLTTTHTHTHTLMKNRSLRSFLNTYRGVFGKKCDAIKEGSTI